MDGVVTRVLNISEIGPTIIAIILGEDGEEYMYNLSSIYELKENAEVKFEVLTSAIQSHMQSDLIHMATGSYKLRQVAVRVREK